MLTIITPTIRLEGMSRDCWLNRLTPAIRQAVAGYETHSYVPINCCGHFDHKDRFWITLERWADYIDHPTRLRDIQRVTLLVKDTGEILSARRLPIERIDRDGNHDAPAAPAPLPDDDGDQGAALIPEDQPKPKRRRRGRGIAVLEAAAPSAS